jgi:CHAT domain-containing protein
MLLPLNRRAASVLATLAVALGSCARPGAEHFVTGGTAGAAEQRPLNVGTNTAGETCTMRQRADGNAAVYCGSWEQPSARIQAGEAAAAGDAAALATASPWRNAIARRLDCNAPQPATILGDVPAAAMQCTRRLGGWPQVALVAVVGGRAYYADGVQPAFQPMQRAIGVIAGRVSADAAGGTATVGLEAARLAAASYSAADIATYEALVRRAALANLAQDYLNSEKAYRAAAAVLDRQTPRNPQAAVPLMSAAVQASNEGRMAEADRLFADAEARAAKAGNGDPTLRPRLAHDRGLHLLNQGKPEQALALFIQAREQYAALLSPEVLRGGSGPAPLGQIASGRLNDQLTIRSVLRDTVQDSAVLGLIESRRYAAVALRQLGRAADGDTEAEAAADLTRRAGLNDRALTARLLRTAGTIAQVEGRDADAGSRLSASAAAFEQSLPGSRPVAVTDLLRAGVLAHGGRLDEALEPCREASAILRARRLGTTPELIAPCLEAFAASARARPDEAQRTNREMFEAAQLAQTSLTTQQIARAAAELQENARDPRAADALKQQKAAEDALDEAQRARDEAAKTGGQPDANRLAELDKRLAEARHAAEDAEGAVQATAPNFPQLVQQAVSADDVLKALHPGEAFAAFMLGRTQGWAFLLRDGRIDIAAIDGGEGSVDPLVLRIRKSVEAGADGNPPAFDAAAAEALYAALFGKLAPRLDGARALVVSPTGSLLSVPFALLIAGHADPASLATAPFLVRRVTIAHVPAAANFVSLRRAAGGSRASKPWFGFGEFRPVTLRQAAASFPGTACADSARDLAGLPPLPGTRLELEAARKLLDASPDAQLLGPAFTVPQVRQVALADYRILHFAAHALLPTDLRCQDAPAIITSPPADARDAGEAMLTAPVAQTLHLDADAVILSACNTGGPGGAAGESLSGLARSFFYAGARSLLVTHWEVNDRYTAYLVAVILGNYKGGPGMAEAVAAAERKLLEQATGPDAWQAHPFFWAPMALIGEGGSPPGRTAAAAPAVPR